MLPSTLDIPESAFYCVECGPANVGLDCDLPGHGEFALLADLNVRECPLCPTWVECAHFGDQCVRLAAVGAADMMCPDNHRHSPLTGHWAVASGRLDPRPAAGPWVCAGWRGRRDLSDESHADDFYATTEAEARAEFERRVALMLEAE